MSPRSAAGVDRRTFMRYTSAIGVATAITAGLSACGGPGSTGDGSGGSGGDTGTIEAGLSYPLSTGFDPMITSGATPFAANMHIFEGLVDLDPATLVARPALATGMPKKINATTYRATLRKGATFHDGSAVTADDVVFSFERVLDPRNASLMAQFVPFIDRVEAVDASTVEFRLKHAFALFPSRISVVRIVPKKIAGADAKAFDAQPVGSGPYRFVSAVREDKIVMEAYDEYNGPHPARAEKMVWHLMSDPSARVSALKSGRVQAIEDVPYIDIEGFTGKDKVESVQSFGLLFLMFNCKDERFADKRVRQALHYALDTEKLISTALLGNAEPATGYVPATHPDYREAATVYGHDLARAKKLLDEAGVGRLSFTLLVTDTGWVKDIAPLIKESWAAAGIEARLDIAQSPPSTPRSTRATSRCWRRRATRPSSATTPTCCCAGSTTASGRRSGTAGRAPPPTSRSGRCWTRPLRRPTRPSARSCGARSPTWSPRRRPCTRCCTASCPPPGRTERCRASSRCPPPACPSSTSAAPEPRPHRPSGRRRATGRRRPGEKAAAEVAPAVDRAEVDAALAELATRLEATEPAVPPLPDDAPDLLVVRDLAIRFPDRYGDIRVVDGISFTVREGETLGLVGESGCGKSITSLAIMGLLARNAEAEGEILYRGRDLLKLSPKERRALMGPQIAMVYQDAMSSLNPSVLIGTQLKRLTSRGGTRTPAELLELVGLSPERTLRSYPHELSGGQRQRVLIAMALSRSPRLLIADEPTTALDVTVQAQVVELLVRLRDEFGFAMVLVSHDLALVGDLAHRVAVMYAGQVAEAGATRSLLTDPAHHYSRGLLGSVVSLEAGAERLHQIRGVVPAPRAFGAGCRFASRCAAATGLCATTPPPAADRAGAQDHLFACHHPAPVHPSAKSLEGAR
ncbi:Vitamin B12 import ATP-binding protein BtuD [Streptomyces griseomycini]